MKEPNLVADCLSKMQSIIKIPVTIKTRIGYDNAAKIAKRALKNKTTLKYETLKSGLINEKEYDKIIDPKKMIYPS